jgi:hypothetical protein
VLSVFKSQALSACVASDREEMVIDLVGAFPHSVRSSSGTQIFSAPYIQIELASGAQGICFVYGEQVDTTSLVQLVGADARQILESVPYKVQVALTDALFAHVSLNKNSLSVETVDFDGNQRFKGRVRAQCLAAAVDAQNEDRVGVIGCVESVIQELQKTAGSIRLSDLHTTSDSICNIVVERECTSILQWATSLLVTGNVLATHSLGLILQATRERNIHTVFYAMTGANIAPHYLDYGAEVVICERFPFYFFSNTSSRLEIYRHRNERRRSNPQPVEI